MHHFPDRRPGIGQRLLSPGKPASRLRQVADDLLDDPVELWGGIAAAVILVVLFATGWFGRLASVLEVVLRAVPPGAIH